MPNDELMGPPRVARDGDRARVSVTAMLALLTVTWEGVLEPGSERIRRERRGSLRGTYIGGSGPRRWFEMFDEGWACGSTRVTEPAVLWGVGRRGFYTIDERGDWTLTRPDGKSQGGSLGPDAIALDFIVGEPWVVFASGQVQPLHETGQAFEVVLSRER